MAYTDENIVRYLAGIVYSQLDFNDEDSYEDFITDVLIPTAEGFIDRFCGHNFNNNGSVTVTVDGNGKQCIVLPPTYYPITDLNSVTISSVAQTVTEFKYYNQYICRDSGVFTEDEQNVTFNIDHGYTSVPDDVSYVCGQLCANMLREMVRSKMMPDLIVPILEVGQARGLGAIMANPAVFTYELRDMLKRYVVMQVEVG